MRQSAETRDAIALLESARRTIANSPNGYDAGPVCWLDAAANHLAGDRVIRPEHRASVEYPILIANNPDTCRICGAHEADGCYCGGAR